MTRRISLEYIGSCCTTLRGIYVEEMTHKSREIKYETFSRALGRDNIEMISKLLGYGPEIPELTLESDYCTRFYSSKYNGKRCYYCDHSCIEYVFTEV